MKLLSKSEVDRLKAVERRRETEEGLKLAKRIDTLREVAAQEEAALEKFRSETAARIYAELEELTKKRDALIREIEALKTRKA